MLGENYGDFVGNATFADPDNDGVCDVLVGAPYAARVDLKTAEGFLQVNLEMVPPTDISAKGTTFIAKEGRRLAITRLS